MTESRILVTLMALLLLSACAAPTPLTPTPTLTPTATPTLTPTATPTPAPSELPEMPGITFKYKNIPQRAWDTREVLYYSSGGSYKYKVTKDSPITGVEGRVTLGDTELLEQLAREGKIALPLEYPKAILVVAGTGNPTKYPTYYSNVGPHLFAAPGEAYVLEVRPYVAKRPGGIEFTFGHIDLYLLMP